MKFLIATDGTWGDVLPFSALAQQLVSDGHDVTFLTNEYYKEYLESKGIRFVRTTTISDREFLLSQKNLWNPYKGLMVLSKATRLLFDASFDPIMKVAQGCDAVISHSFMYSAKTIAEHLKIKHIGLLFAPIQMRSLLSLPTLPGGHDPNDSKFSKYFFYRFADNVLFDPFIAGPINKKRKELGLPKAKGLIQWGSSDTLNIGLWPNWYKNTESDQKSLVTVGFPKQNEFVKDENRDLAEWIEKGSVPIVATLGSGNMFADKLLENIRKIIAQSNERFIFIKPDAQIPIYEDQLVVISRIMLSSVLRQSKLFIHHGGAGSIAQATAAGIPQIILPLSHDQPDNASHVMRNKLGTVIWKQGFTAEELRETIERVTQSKEIADACGQARETIQNEEDGIVNASKILGTIGFKPD